MADAVKKSRIVSEEDKDLEAALLEEFNIRLKNCMSKDDLNKDEDSPEPDAIYEEPVQPSDIETSRTFIQTEIQENFYDVPKRNGHPVEEEENIYENIPEKTERLDQNYVPMLDTKEPSANNSEEYEVMGQNGQSTSHLYESLERPTSFTLPTTSLTDYSDNNRKSPEGDLKASAKDRMLLSTDDTSTLLFTQTVTSPMLTPSEENIDFLKGFQRENTNSEHTSPKEEDLEEQLDTNADVSEPIAEEENFYENTEYHKNTTPENVYENLRNGDEEVSPTAAVIEEEENIYDNLEFRKDSPSRHDRKSLESLEEFIKNEREICEEAIKIEKPPTPEVVVTETTKETYKELIYHKSETTSNYYEKYTEVVAAKSESGNCRKTDTETVPAEIVKNLKTQFLSKSGTPEVVGGVKKEGTSELKTVNIINQIKKFEHLEENGAGDSTEYSETIVETTAPGEMCIKKKKTKKTRKEEKENISVKSSFSKFDALQKKNVLHVRSSDSTKAQEKFNGAQIDTSVCKACNKQVFQMEQIKAEKAMWHKNCFRCTECSKQLTVDTYESNEGSLYCKPHFKALFAPKVIEEEVPHKPRRPELIIRENQPVELPPDVVRASDKPDLGLEELQSLNVKERFQVFEHYQTESAVSENERGTVNVKRSPSILSKLARFQKHGMDIGVSNEALDGIPVEESSSEEEPEEEVPEGEDADLVRAKRVQKEKPFHFTGMSDVKKKWESGDQSKEERREERKQEIQSIRNKLFLGKQEKMKEAYQQAIMESESSANLRKNLSEKIEVCDTRSIKERFEKGEMANEKQNRERNDEEEVYESEMSKKSRSLFLELDASASKPPQMSPVTPPKLEVKKAREAYLAKAAAGDTVKSTESVEEVEVRTADIQERFKFFETYKEPEQERKQFRMTPPRDPSQVKTETPEREIYRDPDVIRSEEYIDDSVVAKQSHTASKMLNKFRQMEENLQREPEPAGPKPLKRFTPPPEPTKPESNSEEESEYEEEEEEEEETVDHSRLPEDVVEAQKAARAKQLRAKFEKWEANEIRREQQNSVQVVEQYGEESQQSQIESTRVLRARFENMKESSSENSRTARVKPNRFV